MAGKNKVVPGRDLYSKRPASFGLMKPRKAWIDLAAVAVQFARPYG